MAACCRPRSNSFWSRSNYEYVILCLKKSAAAANLLPSPRETRILLIVQPVARTIQDSSELPWHVCRCCNNADPTCDELDYPPRSPLESNVLVFTMRISGTIITQEIVDPCSLVCFSEFLVCFDLWFAYVCMFGAEPRFQEI